MYVVGFGFEPVARGKLLVGKWAGKDFPGNLIEELFHYQRDLFFLLWIDVLKLHIQEGNYKLAFGMF